MNLKISRSVGLIIAVTTAFLNYLAFRAIAAHFHSVDPDFIAAAVMTTLIVHEVGHLIAFEMFGFKTIIFFAVIVGGACPLDSKRLKTLSWSKQAIVLMAGVTMNALLIIFTTLLGRQCGLSAVQCDRLINLQATIIVWNLLPLPLTDGAKFLKLLFDSVPEHLDRLYANTIRSIGYAGAIVVMIASGVNFMLGAMLLFFMAGHYATHDDPFGSSSPLAMSRIAQRRWATFYLVLLLSNMWVAAFTYKWLA